MRFYVINNVKQPIFMIAAFSIYIKWTCC